MLIARAPMTLARLPTVQAWQLSGERTSSDRDHAL